ncbi:hypothetical protein HMPREF1211_08555 [Streptomyces sp. HGB0020]|nr:hypothetical protein HMPREF1211_08555 [Streptomyces sp. HGB0020]
MRNQLVGDLVKRDRFPCRPESGPAARRAPAGRRRGRHAQLVHGERQAGHHRVDTVFQQHEPRVVPSEQAGVDLGAGVVLVQGTQGRRDDQPSGVADGDAAGPDCGAGAGRGLDGGAQQFLARGRKTSPASLSRVPCVLRSRRRAPTCCSSRRICRLREGWVVCSASAARPRCRCSAITVKHCTLRRLRAARQQRGQGGRRRRHGQPGLVRGSTLLLQPCGDQRASGRYPRRAGATS